jgi:hypothetical protein
MWVMRFAILISISEQITVAQNFGPKIGKRATVDNRASLRQVR